MAQEQTIFVVSDLHMGDNGPRDNFAVDNKTTKFHAFLDFIQDQNGRLFILGDLFEFWQANIGKVLISRMDFIDRFAEMDATYVVGNHDADFEDLIGSGLLRHHFFNKMTGPFIEKIGGKAFKFMHGHEVDPFNRDGTPRWGRILSILGGLIEDRKGSPMLSAGGFSERSLLKIGRSFMWLLNNSVNLFEKSEKHEQAHALTDSLTPAQDPAKAKGIFALYQKDRLDNSYDYLIAGHTHGAGFFQDWYCNSGCWVGLRSHFLRIEPTAEVILCEWKNNRQQILDKMKLKDLS